LRERLGLTDPQVRGNGCIDPAEWIGVLGTGDDLKAVGSTVKTTGGLHVIEPTVEVLQEAVDDLRLLSE